MKLVALLAILIGVLAAGGCTTFVRTETLPDGTVKKTELYSILKKYDADVEVPTDKGPLKFHAKSDVDTSVGDNAATIRKLVEKGLGP